MSFRIKMRRFSIILVVLLILASALYIYLRNSPLLNIETITVTGNKTVSADELVSMSGIQKGQNLLAVDIDQAQMALSYHPMVKKVTISRSFPKTLVINVEERSKWGIIRFKDEFLCLDAEGYCIDKEANADVSNLVLISLDKLPPYATLGRPFEANAVKAIYTVWSGLSTEERADISEFNYNTGNNNILIYTINGTEIRFGDLSRQAEKLDLLKKSIAMEKQFRSSDTDVIEYIDLRFNGQPVIKTKQ